MCRKAGGRRVSSAAAAAAVMLALLFWPGPARAGEGKTVLTLNECIQRTLKASAEVMGAEYEVEVYRSKKQQADAGRFPQVEVLAYGSLSPRARLKNGRTVEAETNIHNTSYDGVFGRATVQLIQPLYTFGKISGYREAAGHGINAYSAGTKLKASEVALQVKEAFYGLLLAREIKGLLEDLHKEVEKSLEKVEKQLDAGAPGVDQVDLFKLRTILAEMEKFSAQADEGIGKAHYGLRVLMDIPDEEDFDIADEFLIPEDVALEDFDTYRDRAMEGRLEFTQLKEGLMAKKALVDVEKADYYPHLFLAGFASVAGATNRDHLNNPYIFDEFNHLTGGVVLGIKWSIDLGITKGEVNEAKAEYLKLKMTKRYAEDGVPFQVKEALLQFTRSQDEMKALDKGYKSAKQWVVAAVSNLDMGVGDSREIADAVRSYASIRADYFRAVYNQKLALANLEHATGADAMELPYALTPRSSRDYDACRGGLSGI